MRTASLAEITQRAVCDEYPPERVAELAKGKDAISVLDIFACNIPNLDKVLISLDSSLIEEQVLYQLAIDFAEHVLPILDLEAGGDQRAQIALAAYARWLSGGDNGDERQKSREALRQPEFYASLQSDAARAAAEAVWAAGARSANAAAYNASSCAQASAGEREADWQAERILFRLQTT